MESGRVERVKQMVPPDGAEMVDLFGHGTYSSRGLIAKDAEVRFVGKTGGEMSGVGPDAVGERWAEWLSAWESHRLYWEDIFERGDRVVMLVKIVGVTKHGGVAIEQPAAAIFRFEGEQVVEIEFTLDREHALKG